MSGWEERKRRETEEGEEKINRCVVKREVGARTQWSNVLAAKADDLSLILKIHMPEGENLFPQVGF